MKTQRAASADGVSLWTRMRSSGALSGRWISDSCGRVELAALATFTCLSVPPQSLRGRSVLLRTDSQLATALALLELDGIAGRLVLCPPGLQAEHLPAIVSDAAIDCIVSDGAPFAIAQDIAHIDVFLQTGGALDTVRSDGSETTEWILLTSGSTGQPKLVLHNLATLTGAIQPNASGPPGVWSTFYDIRRYGGLQVFLRAMLGAASMVLSNAAETMEAFLGRAASGAVTHISGTPSHWRSMLMTPRWPPFAPRYVRLSGEIADQGILDRLRLIFPDARIAHAFASTEAGVAFEVNDGLEGFPADVVNSSKGPVHIRIVDGSLCIRSARIALRYLGECRAIADADGFVDTGDMVELRNGRYYFIGRRDGMINVGGLKVHPEEVESVINRHPAVQATRVRARKNPVTGAVVSADIVAGFGDESAEGEALKAELAALCHAHLARHKVPASLRLVPSLALAASGKLRR